MKKNIAAALLVLFANNIAQAATEIIHKTYPTRWRLIYDSDRDSTTGDTNLLIEGVGDASNGRVVGGTGTGLVTVYGDLSVTGQVSPEFSYSFTEGASKGIAAIQLDGTVADGTAGAYNMLYFGNGLKMLSAALGAGQTITVPAMAATGLDITGDQADDEGFDLTFGYLDASGPLIIPGTTPAWEYCASITVTDVSDTDELWVGVRKLETVQAAWADYNTYAAIGITAAAATAAIYIGTEDDGGGATETDTTDTWADTATKTLCIRGSAAGALTYTINGSAPTVTAAFTLDDGEPVIPTIRFLHAGAADCVPVVSAVSFQYQKNAFQ